MADRDVKDIDRGWGALVRAMTAADGLEARMGYLSGVPKYPKKRGKTAVAKVAGVHGVHKLISKIWDTTFPERRRRYEAAIERVKGGADPEAELLKVAEWQRDKYQAAIKAAGLVDTGRLVEAVRASVFDGKSFVLGDDPKQPKMGNKGPFR